MSSTVDLTGIAYFNPILSFALILVLAFAVLKKTKILGESTGIQAIISIILSLIFVSVVNVREYVEMVSPWFAVLIVLMFFVIFLAAFALGKPDAIAKPWLAWVFIGLLAIVFLYLGYHQFNVASNSDFIDLKHWIREPKVAGGLWLVIFGVIVTFAITRKAAGK